MRDHCDVSTRLSRPPQTSAASRLVERSPRPPHRGLLLPSPPPAPRAAPGRAFMPRRGPGGFHRCTCPRARKWGDAVLERESLAEPLSGARGGWGDVAFPFLVGGLLCVFNSRSPVAPPPTPPSSATEGAAPRGSRYVLGWLCLQTALPSLRPFSCAGRWGGGAASAVQGGCLPRHPRGLTRLAPAARPLGRTRAAGRRGPRSGGRAFAESGSPQDGCVSLAGGL